MFNLVRSLESKDDTKRYVRVSAMVVKFLFKHNLFRTIAASKYGNINDLRRFEMNRKYSRRLLNDWDSLNLIAITAFNHLQFFWWMEYDTLEKLQKKFPILLKK